MPGQTWHKNDRGTGHCLRVHTSSQQVQTLKPSAAGQEKLSGQERIRNLAMVIATLGYPFVILQVCKCHAITKSLGRKSTTGGARAHRAIWHSAASEIDAIKRGVERR
jgi:hypothetical protein